MNTTGPPEIDRRTVLRGAVGATGAATLSGVASGQESGDGGDGNQDAPPAWPDYVSDARIGSTADLRGESSVTVEVGSGPSGLAFTPTNLWIDPGTEVTFEWVTGGHNVLPESQPSGSSWTGHDPLENAGFSTSFTFETPGMYAYYCRPHEQVGMKGAIAVGDDVPRETPGEDGGFALPGGDLGFVLLAIPFGALLLGMASIFVGEYVSSLRKAPPDVADYGPADDGTTREIAAELPGQTEELDHDSFDPTGTAGLIIIYFLILVGMWIFVYFVEFLGGGPVVTG